MVLVFMYTFSYYCLKNDTHTMAEKKWVHIRKLSNAITQFLILVPFIIRP